jgi:processive 1,2-diacylglycerol beta-glucosyltransferase
VAVTGIPVDPALAAAVDHEQLRRRYRLDPKLPLLLVSAGTSGAASVTQVAAALLRVRQPFQAVIVCGRNAELRHAISQFVAEQQEHIRVLGYTEDLRALMAIATLFVGKPGGLSAAECMAVGLPMVLFEPLPGQESRNADHLLEAGAAVRCHDATTIAYKIDHILADSARSAALRRAAQRFGRPQASHDILSLALHEPKSVIHLSRTERMQIRHAALADYRTRQHMG